MDGEARLIQLKASAGAGKTYALTERFLALLGSSAPDAALSPACTRTAGSGHDWPEIMAVTFTNKAAAEMKERVVGKLKARALGLEPGAADRWPRRKAEQWLTRILRHYQQLNIRTIDSLLNLIMRIFALEVGLAPDFEVFFDVSEVFDELYDSMAAEAEAEDGPQRALLTAALDTMLRLESRPGFQLGEQFRDRLVKMLRHRVRDNAPCETDPDRIHAVLAVLHADFVASVDDLEQRLEGMAVKKPFLNFLAKCRALRVGESVPQSAFTEKASIAECLNKASQGAQTPAHEAAFAAMLAACEEYSVNGKLLAKARDNALFVALADLLAEALAELRGSRNVLMNEQCASLARELLTDGGGVPDAFCRMGARLSHMLVDEFQDTSRDQWDALTPLAEECLSTGGGLLVVGDVKQAIYGWRGGDSRLFGEVPEQPKLTAMAAPHRDSLPYNWRSHRTVVEFNNGFFSRLGDPATAEATAVSLLGDASGRALRDLASSISDTFEGAEQQVPDNHASTGGHVCLTRIHAERTDELEDEVRRAMKRLFSYLGKRRPHGDVAVLVRDNKQATLVADWLIGWGVPVITENSLSLGEHPLVRQLVALLRFFDYPLDDLALWGVLGGGEIFQARTNIGASALTDWLAELDRGPLYHRFREAWPVEAERFLARYVKKAGFMTPYDAVNEVVDDFQVLERSPGGAPFVRRFMEVVHRAEEAGHQSLSAFLEYWDKSGGEEKVPLPDSVDAVRVMTIHQSKGLEFPVAVVPFHHWRFDPGGEPTPFRYAGMNLLAPLCREMGRPYYDEAARTLLEQLNLLYVAWTRPEEELYAFLTSTRHHRGQAPMVRTLEALTEDMDWEEDEFGLPVCRFGEPAKATGVQAPSHDDDTPPVPVPTAEEDDPGPPMSWLPRLKIHRHFAKDVPRDDLLGGGPAFDARARGTLIHDSLDRLRHGGSGLDAAHAARAAVAVHADILPPGDQAREDAVAEIESILSWVLTIPDFPGWAERGHPECPILTSDGNEKRPDLLVTDPEETVIVEYKTGQESPDHVRQVREYMDLLSGMDGVAPAMRAVIIYLDLKTTKEVRP